MNSFFGSITKSSCSVSIFGEEDPVAIIIFLVSSNLLSTSTDLEEMIFASPLIMSTPFFFNRNSTHPVSLLTIVSALLIPLIQLKDTLFLSIPSIPNLAESFVIL